MRLYGRSPYMTITSNAISAEHYEKKYEQKIKDLEDKIASRDATIKNLKTMIERKQQEWDEKKCKTICGNRTC